MAPKFKGGLEHDKLAAGQADNFSTKLGHMMQIRSLPQPNCYNGCQPLLMTTSLQHLLSLYNTSPCVGGNLGDRANIDSFGLSLTTLEEVFIKVGEEEPHETGADKDDHEDDPPPNNEDNVVQFKVFKRAGERPYYYYNCAPSGYY